jgi:siroheme synthase
MSHSLTIPKLTLVGAGPGDPDLISVKGIKALADADVVLYDALAMKNYWNMHHQERLRFLLASVRECTARSSRKSTN